MAGDGPDLRLSDADRELLYEKLSRHAAEGRLSVEELERRVAAVAAAQTRVEAATALGDLPPLPDPVAGARQARSSRGRGHADADAPEVDWHPTAERFRDPGSGRIMRVWVDSAGGRHYVADS